MPLLSFGYQREVASGFKESQKGIKGKRKTAHGMHLYRFHHSLARSHGGKQ